MAIILIISGSLERAKALFPSQFRMFVFAPLESSKLTASILPFQAAAWSAVSPNLFYVSTMHTHKYS